LPGKNYGRFSVEGGGGGGYGRKEEDYLKKNFIRKGGIKGEGGSSLIQNSGEGKEVRKANNSSFHF